jgi:glycosyltransferase involved in cell wall biosynthesis
MKIAQVAPLIESVPPRKYGGTERVVSYLTEELVRLGHEVTLFASGDSRTSARLKAVCPEALRWDSSIVNQHAPLSLLLEKAFNSQEKFDLIHAHIGFLGFPLARHCTTPVLTTLHDPLDTPEAATVFHEFDDLPLVSISNAQRRPIPWANWQETVYHGMPHHLCTFHPQPGQYLAFLGRITPVKRPDHAIEIAKRVGIPLRIAAKVDPTDRAYFKEEIEPLLDHPLVEYIGEINDSEKNTFLGNALALLAPIEVSEPFGLVLIEAMASGTPVVAYRRGSIPEIIDEGITGFVCDSLEQMVEAVHHIPRLDRHRCRQVFEARFTANRMAQDYAQLYERLLDESTPTINKRPVTLFPVTDPWASSSLPSHWENKG